MEDGYFLVNTHEPYGEFYIDKKYYDEYYEKYPYSIRYNTVCCGIRDKSNSRILRANYGDYIFECENKIKIIKPDELIGFYNERWNKNGKEERKV